jgi:hypothetical protein
VKVLLQRVARAEVRVAGAPVGSIGAGLLAKKAVERGLETRPWVKSSLAPGSKVVTAYYDAARLTQYLDQEGAIGAIHEVAQQGGEDRRQGFLQPQ